MLSNILTKTSMYSLKLAYNPIVNSVKSRNEKSYIYEKNIEPHLNFIKIDV